MKKRMPRTVSLAAAAVIIVMAGFSARAAVLSQVPVQNYGGGTSSWMLMPLISYREADGRIHVTIPTPIPQLTPLLVSNPSDTFDPGDPWFEALAPGRQGASFSRRYGFMMDSMSDPLPDGTQIWIRKVSGSAGLNFYRYSGSEPKAFEPIFGTDGTTNALHWNATMFHPVAAAPAGTNNCSAAFEVFLLNIATGVEVVGSTSGPLTLEWTNVSDGRPALHMVAGGVVALPLEVSEQWVLETAESAAAASWSAVTNSSVMIDGRRCVVVEDGSPQRSFRMRYVP